MGRDKTTKFRFFRLSRHHFLCSLPLATLFKWRHDEGKKLLVVGTIATILLGFLIGLGGGLASVLIGLAVAIAIAIVDFLTIHPQGINGPSNAWPWGAVSPVTYVAALAAGLIMSLR